MGDNRDESRDARFFGTRPIRDLLGRGVGVMWSWNQQFFRGPRWSRIGRPFITDAQGRGNPETRRSASSGDHGYSRPRGLLATQIRLNLRTSMEARTESRADLRAILAVRLRDKGLRVTQQRVAVFRALCPPRRSLPTAQGSRGGREPPRADRVARFGLQRPPFAQGKRPHRRARRRRCRRPLRRESRPASSLHLPCLRRGRGRALRDVREAPRPRLADGHTVEDYTVTLRGVCPRCAKA